MKTLTHWQWLILNKGQQRLGPLKKQLLLLQPTATQQIHVFYGFDLKVWLSEAGVGLAHMGRTQRLTGEALVYGKGGQLHFFRSARGSKATRSLDHAFLAYGLLRFGEELSGGAFSLLILKNLLETASPAWLMEVFFFHSRLAQLFKLSRARKPLSITSPGHPWYGGAQMVVSSICSRDPFLLTQWAKKRMARMKLFSHKRFLRLLGSFLRGYVNLRPSPTAVLGFNLVTTGKISVTGNAMSRTMLTRFGKAGINNLSYRASSSFTLIRTKTGCLGLNLVFYY